MPKLRTLALGAFLFAFAALALSACGGGSVPGNAVVKVSDQSIKRSTFDHWMRIIAVSSQAQQNPSATTAPKVSVPDAPDFVQCVAAKRKTTPKPAKGQPEVTDAQLKTQCKQEYDGYKTQVLSYLIRVTWLDLEAAKQGLKVTDKEVDKQLVDARKQAQLQTDDAWQRFLVRSGLTNADVLFQQRGTLLERKITNKVTKAKGAVTDAQVQAYYNAHKQQFAQPERRDLRIVLTKTKATADQAKSALQSGQSWKAVAKRYSTDQASKAQGGQLLGVAKGQQEQALDTAVFGAAKGKLSGPIKTQFGWYVFEVTKITKGTQQSLEASKDSIKQILANQSQQKAITAFGKDYRNRWKAKTACRKDYVVDDCKNAPKPKAGTTSTSTAPPGAQTTPAQGAQTTTSP
jgi:foldase protein PrsA